MAQIRSKKEEEEKRDIPRTLVAFSIMDVAQSRVQGSGGSTCLIQMTPIVWLDMQGLEVKLSLSFRHLQTQLRKRTLLSSSFLMVLETFSLSRTALSLSPIGRKQGTTGLEGMQWRISQIWLRGTGRSGLKTFGGQVRISQNWLRVLSKKIAQ